MTRLGLGHKNTHTLSIGAQIEKIQVKIDGLSSQIIWSRGVSFVAIDICKLMTTYKSGIEIRGTFFDVTAKV